MKYTGMKKMWYKTDKNCVIDKEENRNKNDKILC